MLRCFVPPCEACSVYPVASGANSTQRNGMNDRRRLACTICPSTEVSLMKRLLGIATLALPLLTLAAAPAYADAKTRDKTTVKFEGMLGRMFNMFGGKAAKKGVGGMTAVKGSRKATLNDTTGQIVDLSEEKVYDLDMRKKTYTVTTFEELRQRMR